MTSPPRPAHGDPGWDTWLNWITSDHSTRITTLETTYQFRPETYGAVGDGTTNDSVAIRNCINAAVTYAQAHTNYAEVVFDPSKTYLVSGATVQSGTTKGNALIPLPIIPVTSPKVTLVLRGGRDVAGLMHWQQTSAQKTGAVIKTTLVGTNDGVYGEASVIGGPTPIQGYPTDGAGNNTFNNMMIVVDGVCLQLPNDPHVCGFDFRGMANAAIDNASVFTTGTPGAYTPATQGWQFGLAMPWNNNNARSTIGYYAAYMQNFGVMTSEHTVAEAIYGVYCVAAIEHGAGGGTGHGAVIKYACCESNQVGLGFIDAAYAAKINIDVFDVEANTFMDINDPLNMGTGNIGFQDTSMADTGGANPSVNGAGNLRIIQLSRLTGWAGNVTLPASGTALRNPFWRDAAVTITGGSVSAALVDARSLGATVSAGQSLTVFVPSGKSIQLNYADAPTWEWILL